MNAAPATDQYVQLENLSNIPGANAVMPQPHIAATLITADVKLSGVDFGALDKLLGRLLALPIDGSDCEPASPAHRIGCYMVDILKHLGYPVPADCPVATQLATDRVELRVPVVQGAHPPLGQMLSLLVELTDRWLADALPPEDQVKQHLDRALSRIGQHAPQGKNTAMMLRTARQMGIPWLRIYGNIYQLGQGHRARRMDSSATDHTSRLGSTLAQDKTATNYLLSHAGFPVPPSLGVHNEAQGIRAAERLGYPVVVKPADRDRGEGVTAGIKDADTLKRALAKAAGFSPRLIVEKHFPGNDHRLHVFEGRVYRARQRLPGGVTGDGVASVQNLVNALNDARRRRAPGTNHLQVPIEIDSEAEELLSEQGLTLESVPDEGRFVQLRRIANMSVGGVSRELALKAIHPDNIRLAERAVRAIHLDIAALDLLIPDITRSWLDVGAVILEINAKPQFGEDAPRWIFKQFFPRGGRIPIAVVIGDGAEPNWLDALGKHLAEEGRTPGLCSPTGAWIGGDRIAPASSNLYRAGLALIQDPTIQCMLMLADQSLLESGLPMDHFDVLAVIAPEPEKGETAKLIKALAPMADAVWFSGNGADRQGKSAEGDGAHRTFAPNEMVERLRQLLSQS